MILTSHDRMGAVHSDAEPTGVWLEEFTTPFYAFLDAGLSADVYSILGGPAPIDPRSVQARGENPASVERYFDDPNTQTRLGFSWPLSTLDISAYDGLFLAGGHGTVWDFTPNKTLAARIRTALDTDTFVAAVCHGPSGLLGVRDGHGRPVIAGRRVTGFSNREERAVGLDQVVPFRLETQLKAQGAHYMAGPDFQSFAVRDGHLITGQNPISSAETAQLLIEAVNSAAAIVPQRQAA
ncbi:MAG: type 1 glutamine amidotransferase domain-containing protein [Candidatus Competibacteraceae bacterium]|nr:type 1 glutamine amidotransferase domain-containing protein [Candidatus Competibacteraceae bacterium]